MTRNASRHDTDYRHLLPLFAEAASPSIPEAERNRLREVLLRGHLPLAEHIAWRYRGRGQAVEDLEQVARLGLLLAIDRFDPLRGTDFVAFAVPTIVGELRRYFRDHTWTMSVPRRFKDLCRAVRVTTEELSIKDGRAPRPRQIADALGISVEDVCDALQAGFAYRPESLDAQPRCDDATPPHLVGRPDPELALVDERAGLYQALGTLPEREAAAVVMRFFGNLTQTQIGDRLGMSQMQVSRLLSRALATLRRELTLPADSGTAPAMANRSG